MPPPPKKLAGKCFISQTAQRLRAKSISQVEIQAKLKTLTSAHATLICTQRKPTVSSCKKMQNLVYINVAAVVVGVYRVIQKVQDDVCLCTVSGTVPNVWVGRSHRG